MYKGPLTETCEPMDARAFQEGHRGDLWGKIGQKVLEYQGIEQTPDSETHFIIGPYSNRLAVEVSGPEDGYPILCVSGTPGGRCGPKPTAAELPEGVRSIWYDKPGYGWSTRLVGRTALDAVADAHHIIKYFDLPSLSVIGRSSGAGPALAIAALTKEVKSAAAVVPLAPQKPMGDDWYIGMNSFNTWVFKTLFSFSDTGKELVSERLTELEQMIKARLRQPTQGQVDDLQRGITDRSLGAHAAALRFGSEGRLDDHLAYVDWEFPLEALQRIPTLVWTAEQDEHTPPSHAKFIARKIGANTTLHLEADATHHSGVESTAYAMKWCMDHALSN